MEKKWMYQHDGQTHGPFTVAQMRELALAGKIAPADKIWMEGADLKTAIRAEQALTFKPSAKKVETSDKPKAPLAKPVTSASRKLKKKTSGSHSGTKKAPRVAPVATPIQPPELPIEAIPVLEAIPVMEAIPIPDAAPAGTHETAPISPNLRRAIDAVHEPNLPLGELYRRAHFALSQWADQDENAELILAGDTEAILRQPAVLEILGPFQSVSFDVLERLMESLDFLVENRSKYYRAMMARGKKP